MLTGPVATQLATLFDRAMGMANIIRYYNQFHWKQETAAYETAHTAEGDPRLESVSDHSWHMMFMAQNLLPYFPELDANRVYELVIVHDILELITGDKDPTGHDGQGTETHAFNAKIAQKYEDAERTALPEFIGWFPAELQALQSGLQTEWLDNQTAEARFTKVIDKIQALVYIKAKKRGDLSDEILQFLMNYKAKTLPKFPALAPLYDVCMENLVASRAKKAA